MYRKRTTKLSCRKLSCLAAIMCAALLLPEVAAAADGHCGMGPAPGSAGFAQFRAKQAEEQKRNGFRRVCDANLDRYRITASFSPLGAVLPQLHFTPVALERTPFAALAPLGALLEDINGIRSRLYRGFRLPGGHTLVLFEHDMSADGSQTYRHPAAQPERIKGLPARLDVLEGDRGKAMSILSWTEGRRYIELWLDVNVAREKALGARLFELAAALPKSIPARAREPNLTPFTMTPDGQLITPPPPPFLPPEDLP